MPGGTSRSYGIQVARIAGLPETVLRRAKEILDNLESTDLDGRGRPFSQHPLQQEDEGGMVQLNLFGSQDRRLSDWIMGLDISCMTPIEALTELNNMQVYVRKGL